MTRSHQFLLSLAVAFALAAASVPASAAVFNFVGPIDVTQATTCGSSSAQGNVVATLDDQSGVFSWTVTFGTDAPIYEDGNLSQGAQTAAHFHGPAAPGEGAGVEQGIANGSPSVGNATLNAGQIADLLAGLWYMNIHSDGCGGGEIRGQVLLVVDPVGLPALSPWSAGLLLMALIALAVTWMRREGARTRATP